ncbi:hypothetical protein O6H91_16G036200 [Diphasiastrum complanatum]|uniref:Uncharacterized protein n=1 Tax=Diphasiastrum complanatum TaxID=34168 RepID=A0ACC2BBI5_DIPCM|nr:hypothetical protein O6H91_16G036200 [Diphasiastrum complanatum]
MISVLAACDRYKRSQLHIQKALQFVIQNLVSSIAFCNDHVRPGFEYSGNSVNNLTRVKLKSCFCVYLWQDIFNKQANQKHFSNYSRGVLNDMGIIPTST